MLSTKSDLLPHSSTQANRLQQLDGLRALLALWVLFGHTSIFMGCNWPLLNNPAIAVDLFIVLSGLFIAITFDSLRRRHAYFKAARYFWVRRVLRIWPLYVVLLTLCWLFIDDLDRWMQIVSNTFPRTTNPQFVAPDYHLLNLKQLLLHYTLLFGVVPSAVAITPLPDWSLSLEFQFYLLFPLIFLATQSRLLLTCLLAACFAYISPALLGFYLDPGHWAHFEQPSALPYKLNLFLVGVLFNTILKSESHRELWLPVVAIVMCLAMAGFLTTLGSGLILYLLVRPESQFTNLFKLPLLRFFGEISYTIYLVHRPLLLGIAATLAAFTTFVTLPSWVRFAFTGITLLLSTTLVAWMMYITIERPFNRWGHRWTSTPNQMDQQHKIK